MSKTVLTDLSRALQASLGLLTTFDSLQVLGTTAKLVLAALVTSPKICCHRTLASTWLDHQQQAGDADPQDTIKAHFEHLTMSAAFNIKTIVAVTIDHGHYLRIIAH